MGMMGGWALHSMQSALQTDMAFGLDHLVRLPRLLRPHHQFPAPLAAQKFPKKLNVWRLALLSRASLSFTTRSHGSLDWYVIKLSY